MRVLVAPDAFKGTLTAEQAATAIAAGWRRARPDDRLELLPLADGGDGLCAVLARVDDRWLEVEVVGPLARPVTARALVRADGTAVVESAEACGLHLVPEDRRTPMHTTTFGVGELLRAVVEAGARHVLLGLGGSATVDAGLGALTGLGYRLRTADGSGLKIGGGEIHRLASIEPGWATDLDDIEVELLADVETRLADAATVFGPQKGAGPQEVAQLTAALEHVASVVARDLPHGAGCSALAGSGAAGGLGFGLAAALGARFVPGAARVAELVGLPAAVERADVVVTGEGRLDATSLSGKVIGALLERTAQAGDVPTLAVVGRADDPRPAQLAAVEEAAPKGPGADPAAEVAAAATRLATRFGSS